MLVDVEGKPDADRTVRSGIPGRGSSPIATIGSSTASPSPAAGVFLVSIACGGVRARVLPISDVQRRLGRWLVRISRRCSCADLRHALRDLPHSSSKLAAS